MSMEAPRGGAQARSLRQAIYAKDAPTRTDLVGLMALGADSDDAEFLALVADVAADVLVGAADAPGSLSEADSDWLIAHLGDGRGLGCRAEFEALKSVLARAVAVPPGIASFAVREIERAILTGRRGPLGGADWTPGAITAGDVEALRAVVFAGKDSAACHVDAATAEALFDIAHATATAHNDSTFPDFFARAVGNYLAGAVFAKAPTRAQALEAQADWERPVSLGDFLRGLSNGYGGGDGAKSVDQLAEEAYHAENEATQARLEAAARIDAGEARWILAHLTRGGELCEAELRLLAFLRAQNKDGSPDLGGLLEQAA